MTTSNQPIAILSTTHTITTAEDKAIVASLYAKTKWQTSTQKTDLFTIHEREDLIVIRTDNLVVIDFDDDQIFQEALKFNSSLRDEDQCKYIVKSLRHGGHFYFAATDPAITFQQGHTKQRALDILSTNKHNVIAPTKADKGKVLLIHEALTPYNETFNTFVTLKVLQNLPEQQRATLVISNERKSDDAKDFIKSYLANIVSQQAFNKFYNVPDPIPQGMSNQVYLSLSTRLASDETISKEDYLQTMEKFNLYHQRKTPEELRQTITDRMVNNKNGLWRYDENKQVGTFTTTHRRFKTQIESYYDAESAAYLIHFLNKEGQYELHKAKNLTAYLELMEKISDMPRQSLRNATKHIAVVDVISTYSKPAGYDAEASTYNTAYINSNLAAFNGTKPLTYEQPDRLIDMLKYMWGESYTYMLNITKHRYSSFDWSPVVTFLQGTEGSGKDLTISLLSAGFSTTPQTLNYSLMKDVHSNWQTKENAIFSEVGDWKPMEREDLLSQLKTISGSNGKVTFRDMQKTAIVVPTIIKIWITGNHWVKLHSDPLTQRRIHIVYMPNPLEKELGGPYSKQDISDLMSDESIQNFYYWLGNVYQYQDFSIDKYNSAVSQQHTEGYRMYIEDTESKGDKVATLLWAREWRKFKELLDITSSQMSDFDFRYSKGQLVIAARSLKTILGHKVGGDIIPKTINRLATEKEANRRLKFSKGSLEKYVTIYNAPSNLNVEEIPGDNIELE